jgi:hypothetical protein
MIYTIYEKIIELSKRYQVCDYLTYMVFILFVCICSLSIVVYL